MKIETTNNNYLLPYEKCVRYGISSLTNEELLAVIIRNGTKDVNCLEIAHEIIKKCGSMGILGLKHLALRDYQTIKGVGKVKSIMLQCIGELSTRISKASFGNRISFLSSKEVADYCMETLRHLENEHFLVLLLNNKCQLIHEHILSEGTVNQTCISPREIYKCALNYGAVFIIMVHNHPSGDPTPSKEDCDTTNLIAEAGEILGIPLIDHVIIGDNKYISFKEENLI